MKKEDLLTKKSKPTPVKRPKRRIIRANKTLFNIVVLYCSTGQKTEF